MPCIRRLLMSRSQLSDFLDHETARIDALIAKQERLIELLEEKRQAAISDAVSRWPRSDCADEGSGSRAWLGSCLSIGTSFRFKYVARWMTVGIVVTADQDY